MKNKNFICIEEGCKKKVWGRNTRCRLHAEQYKTYPSRKGKNNPSFKDGRTLKTYYCIDCGKELSSYQAKRCRSCAQKNRLKNPKNHPMFGNPRKDLQILFKGKNNPMFGKHPSLETRKRLSKKRKGKNNPNYKDGRTPLNRNIRNLFENKQWIKTVLKRDNFTCQECGDNKGDNLEVHHKITFAKILQEFLTEYNQFSPIEDKETLVRLAMKWKPFWEVDNGQTLCEDCHKNINKLIKVRGIK